MSLIMNAREDILKDILSNAKYDDIGTYLLSPRLGKSRVLIEIIKKFIYLMNLLSGKLNHILKKLPYFVIHLL